MAPSICEWANSVDAVVFGTVDAVRPLTSPVWVTHPPYDRYLADECGGGFVNIGVSFELTVMDVLYGDAADEIVVHVGNWDMDENLGEHASLDEDGELEWHGRQTDILEPGTTVGMAITKVPDAGVWSLMGELPFTFGANGSSRFVRAETCDFVSPEPLPADFTSLKDELDRCEVTTNDRREHRLFMYSPPSRSYAAVCHIH